MEDKISNIVQHHSGEGDNVKNKITNIYSSSFKNLTQTSNGVITFDPSTLREVIVSIDKSVEKLEYKATDFISVDVEKKNKLNGLSQDFYDDIIAIDFEPYFAELDSFLKQRENEDLQLLVNNIVNNLNRKISMKRRHYETFEELLDSISDALWDAEYIALKNKEDSITFFLYYLYANCFIGKKTEEEKDATTA